MIGSDFVWEETPAGSRRQCSECGTRHRKMLVSRRNGRVKKVVCSEECRVDFDDAYWQHRADQREASA